VPAKPQAPLDPWAGDPLAPPAKPQTPAQPQAPAKPQAPPPQDPKAGDPLAPPAGAKDPLAVLREVDRYWLYEMVQGTSLTTLQRPPNTHEAVLVRCKIVAWAVPAPLTGSRFECQTLGAPDGPEGPTSYRSLVFDAAGVREVDDENDLTDRSRTGGITFPRALDGRWKLEERGAGDRRVQVIVREETAPVRGTPQKLWVAEATKSPPAGTAPRAIEVQTVRYVPGTGPVLLCTQYSSGDFHHCLRLVETPPPSQPEHVTIAAHQAHEPSSLRSRDVSLKIETTYGSAVRRCYLAALAKRPGLRGTLTLHFTVNAVGKVEGFTATGLDAGMAACVKAAAAAWRFPIPISAYAEPRSARFTIGLMFTPPSP
jgi:hypothetical protein